MKKDQLIKLVKDAKKGSVEAFATLYSTFARSVYYVAIRVTKNEHDANDVIQETMLKFYQKLGEIADESAIPSFLRTTAYNCSIDLLRKNKSEIIVEDEIIENASPLEEDFVPERYLETEETRNEVVQIINNLSDAQRTAVMMYYYDDLSIREIATTMNVEEAVVTSRLYRARNILKEKLSGVKVKEMMTIAITTTVLSQILAMDAKAIFTKEVSTSNWQTLGSTLNYSEKAVIGAMGLANQGLAAPPLVGFESAATQSVVKTAGGLAKFGAGKIAALGLAGAVAVSSVGYGGYHIYANSDSNKESFIIESKTLDGSESGETNEYSLSGSPNQNGEDSFVSPTNPTAQSGWETSPALSAETVEDIKVENLIVRYKKNQAVSEEQLISKIGISSDQSVNIKVEYFDSVDFSKPDEYFTYVYVNDSSGNTLEQLVIIIIIEE